METMYGMALCAGYGGLDLGLDLALGGRLRTVCYVEREARSAETLVARMEESTLERAPIWDDLRTFDGRPWRGRVDILTAGYPCQPFSSAGKRLGADDPRHLWPEVRRILRETGAPVAFFENVRGHVSKGLADVLANLDADGFDAEWGVLGAGEVGAPHKRERLWILAWRRDLGSGGVSDSDGLALRVRAERGPSGAQAPDERDAELGYMGGAMADADGEKRKRLCIGTQAQVPQSGSLRGRRLWPPGPNDADAWRRVEAETQPAIRGVANGSSSGVDDRDRLRMLGNGVVPLAAAVAFRTLAARAGLVI